MRDVAQILRVGVLSRVGVSFPENDMLLFVAMSATANYHGGDKARRYRVFFCPVQRSVRTLSAYAASRLADLPQYLLENRI